jgi:hypothetical protein
MRLSVLCFARKGNGVELLLWGGFPQFLDGATVGCGSLCCLRICYLHGGLTGISLCCFTRGNDGLACSLLLIRKGDIQGTLAASF